MDDLTTLLEHAARDALLPGAPSSPVELVDPVAIRARVDQRRRRRMIAVASVIVLLMVLPFVALLDNDQPEVLIDQPTPDRPPSPVYGRTLDISSTVSGIPSSDLVVTGLSERQAPSSLLLLDSSAGLILTADEPVTVDLDQIQADRGVTAVASRIVAGDVVLDQSSVVLDPGVPTLVLLQVEGVSEDVGPDTLLTPFIGELTITLPIQSEHAGQGTIAVEFMPRDLTAQDYDVEPAVDIPDETFPRPSPGEANPTRLADGTPIWIVGLDDDVAVVAARSPHTPSGLVGWCGTMPGFIDSPGASRLDSRGGYFFGPAPTGLTPYAVDAGVDQVTVTERLWPPPRSAGSTGSDNDDHFPQIEGSSLPQGPVCDTEPPPEGTDSGTYIEDYSNSPGWVQHDLSEWPAFTGQEDGWFVAEEAEIEGVGRYVGHALIHRVDGRTVDRAAPPGTPRILYPDEVEPPLQMVTAVVPAASAECPACADGSVGLRGVQWLTPTTIVANDEPLPPGPVALVADQPLYVEGAMARQPVAPEVDLAGLSPGELVRVTYDDEGRIGTIEPLDN